MQAIIGKYEIGEIYKMSIKLNVVEITIGLITVIRVKGDGFGIENEVYVQES